MAYQDAPTPPMTEALRTACAHAIHVLVVREGGSREGDENGDIQEILKAGRAALFILRQLGWARTARVLGVRPFLWGVELGYLIISRNRRFFSRFLFRRE